MININNTAVCFIWKLLREEIIRVLITNKKGYFFPFFFLVSISYDGCSYCGYCFMMHVNQMIILYTSNLHNIIWKKVKILGFPVVSYSLQPHQLYPKAPWNSPDKNTEVSSHFLPQGIFPSQGLNSGLLHSKHILHHLSHRGSRLYFKTQKKHV